MTRGSRLVGGGIAALLIAPWLGGFVAGAASAAPPVSGDPRATAVAGNAVTCADVGYSGDTQFGADNSSGNTADGFTVTSDGQNLTITAIPANTTIDVLVVKGGAAYNVYPGGSLTLPASGLHAPLVGNPPKNVPTISHWFLCYGATPPQVTPPTATSTGDCDGADLTLDAGTLATIFTVTRAGDASGQTYPVAAGASEPVHVTLDATHSAVSVTAGGPALTTFTRDNAVCDAGNGNGGGGNGGGGGNNGGGGNGNGGGNNGGGGNGNGGGNNGGGGNGGATVANPTVSATKTCAAGITVSLGNLAATAPVNFTVTAPDGSRSLVTVAAGGSTTRSFAVAEDTTGTVSVAAPGLATRTITYRKDCVSVLGVKHVRHHRPQHRSHPAGQGDRTQVLGASAQLPFTGFNARRAAIDAALLIGLGLALCVAGARRRTA